MPTDRRKTLGRKRAGSSRARGINLVVAAIFGFLAARSSPGHAEREALRVRRQALEAARGSLAFTAAIPAATTLLRLRGGKPRPTRLRLFG
jgi:hypothetical protein